MADTVTIHNLTDRIERLEFLVHSPTPSHPKAHYEVFEVPARGSKQLPIRYFRGVFQVRCAVPSCRERGYCTKAHAGDMVPAQAQRLTYEPIADEGRPI